MPDEVKDELCLKATDKVGAIINRPQKNISILQYNLVGRYFLMPPKNIQNHRKINRSRGKGDNLSPAKPPFF